MTIKDAIGMLQMIPTDVGENIYLGTWYKGIEEDLKEALDMAIAALEEEEKQ